MGVWNTGVHITGIKTHARYKNSLALNDMLINFLSSAMVQKSKLPIDTKAHNVPLEFMLVSCRQPKSY